MRFYFVSAVALFLNGGSASGTVQPSIGRFELLAAGNGTSLSPYGEVLSLEPLNGKVYIEAPEGYLKEGVTVELFTNATGTIPCVNGTTVRKGNPQVDFSAYNGNAAKYPATTSNGKIGVAEFTIGNYLEAGIFTAGSDGVNGVIDLCVRTSIKEDLDGKKGVYVSFVDSHMKINANISANFTAFSQRVNITATEALVQETSIVKTVEVESFLCGKKGINDGKPIASEYKIGQDFSVCVRPTLKYADDYKVTNFRTITCGYRKLVTNMTAGTLTTVDANTTGIRIANGTLAGNSSAVFTSVVTSGYFAGGNTSFTCDGEAILKATKGRRLTTRFSQLSVSEQALSRMLQEANPSEESSFATTINLASDSADVDGLAAPAFTTTQGGWGLLIASVALMVV